MGLAQEFTIGNTKIKIWDDFCSAPDQAERDAAIRKRFYADALAEIRANPERYYAVLEMKERGEEWPDEKCCRAEMVERYIERRKKERGADGKF